MKHYSLDRLTLAILLIALCPLLVTSTQAKRDKKKNKDKNNNTEIKIDSVKGDHLTLFYGNSLATSIQENGTLESLLQASKPGAKLQIRALARDGDQIHHRSRSANFSRHLNKLLSEWKPDKVVCFFGMNESFSGAATVKTFESNLDAYLGMMKKRHPKAKLSLVSPFAQEGANKTRLADIQTYTKAMEQQAKAHGVHFIDLFTPTKELKGFTTNGIHLNEQGHQKIATLLAKQWDSPVNLQKVNAQSEGFKNLQKLVSRKAYEVTKAHLPSNAVHYYGVRARNGEYNSEIFHHIVLAGLIDQTIWKQATNLNSVVPLPKLPIVTSSAPNKPPRVALGKLKTPKEDLKDFKLAKDFEVNLFASSEQFPELVNPIQSRFDSKGRLWVSCYTSYPVHAPGTLPDDKILILEDTNNDGKADKCTVFADGLALPDGFVFYKDGIIASVSYKLIFLRDTNGDDKADEKITMLRGLDDTDTHHGGHLTRSLQGHVIYHEALFHRAQIESPFGMIHTRDTGTIFFDPETYGITLDRQTDHPNPWKISYNRVGDAMQMFGGGQIIDVNYYSIRTPSSVKTSVKLGMPFRYDKGCSLEFVTSPHFPKEWQGGLLTAHLLTTNVVTYTPLTLEGGAYKGAKTGKVDLISSTNKSFRPTDLAFGLDGALYVADFYYPIIGHAQHGIRHEHRDTKYGRIWRVTRKNSPLTKSPKLHGASISKLFSALNHSLLRVREVARLELEKHDKKAVLAEAKKHLSTKDPILQLELMWLQERIRNTTNTAFYTKLTKSSDKNVQRSVAYSLRWWAESLGREKAKAIVDALLKSRDDRTQLGVVSSLSHLAAEDPYWKEIIDAIPSSNKRGPFPSVVEYAKSHSAPPLGASIPILKIPAGATDKSKWISEKKEKSLYIKSAKKQTIIIGAEGPSLSTTHNNTEVTKASTGIYARGTQAQIDLTKGINRIAIVGKSKAALYLVDQTGNLVKDITYPKDAKEAALWAKEFAEQRSKNWKVVAEAIYRNHAHNCASCHSLDGTDPVAPSFKGLFGKKQTVIQKDGTKKQVIIDEAYIRRAILDPQAERGEKHANMNMPATNLTKDELNTLVKWIKSLK